MPDVLDAFDRSPAGILRYYDLHGRLPFEISGGSGLDDGDGDEGDGGNDAGDGNEGDDGRDTGKDGEGDSDAPLKSALEAERTARKRAEKASRDLQKRITALENAGKPEADQLKSQIDELKLERDSALTKLQTTAGRVAIIEAAVKAGSPKPGLVYRLVRDNADFNDEYEVTNVAALISQAKTDAPELFRTSSGKGDGGSRDEGGHSTSSGGMNAFIRRAAGVNE